MTVHLRHGAEPQEQLPGRLGSHTGNPGMLSELSPMRLSDPPKWGAGSRTPPGRPPGHSSWPWSGPCFGAASPAHGVDELQAVLVPGDHHAVPVLLAAPLAHGADDVVCLPALALQDGMSMARRTSFRRGICWASSWGIPWRVAL